MPRLRVYDSKEEAAAAAAEFILGKLNEALDGARRATLAVSGGSTPQFDLVPVIRTLRVR